MATTKYENHIMEVEITSAVPISVTTPEGANIFALLEHWGETAHLSKVQVQDGAVPGTIEMTAWHANGVYEDLTTIAGGPLVSWPVPNDPWYFADFVAFWSIREQLRQAFAPFNPVFVFVEYL